MSESKNSRREFLVGGAAAVAAVAGSALSQSAAAGEAASGSSATPKYAITTLHLRFNKDAEFDTLMRAVIPLLKKRGVKLVRAWTPAIGQYRKMVGVWEAATYDDFMTAFADPALAAYRERMEALGSAKVEFATILVAGTKTLSPEVRRKGVMATGTVTIQPGKAPQFAKIVEDSIRIMGKKGLVLDASYHTQIGDRNQVLDVWWAPDANAAYASVMDPDFGTQLVDLDWTGTLAGEGSELAEVNTELFFD